jgi:hypothetical protein
MNLDPTVLAFRSTAEGAQKVLNELEAELAEAKSRRDVILNDISKANDASVRDHRARMELPGLNKQEVSAGRLIVSIERQIVEARKRVAMTEAHAVGAAARRAEMEDTALIRDKWFECLCPDGVRKVRHRHSSLVALQRELQPGYRAIGQVFGTNEDGTGGFVAERNSDMMQAMLDAYGDTLLAFLEKNGITGNPVKIVLPHNGRELGQ